MAIAGVFIAYFAITSIANYHHTNKLTTQIRIFNALKAHIALTIAALFV